MHAVELPTWAIERGLAMRSPRLIVPRKTAVIAIDLQNFFMLEGRPMATPHACDIVANVNALTGAFRRAGAKIAFTQHSPAAGGRPKGAYRAPLRQSLEKQLLPNEHDFAIHSVVKIEATDFRVTKSTASALHPKSGNQLLEWLSMQQIETLIICGLVTNGCCETTARDAHQHGFQVVVCSDACAALTDEEHSAALLNLAIYFAQIRSTAELLDLIKALNRKDSQR